MIRRTTTDFIDKLNIAKSLYSKFDDEAEKKLSKSVIEKGMNEVYAIGNKVMMGVIGLHFLLAMLFAFVKNDWILPSLISAGLLSIFYVSVWKMPHNLMTRILAGIVLQGFGLLYLYQLQAIPEVRFLFFASFTFLIVYQDIKVLYPAAILFISQLILLIFLGNNIENILKNYPQYQSILNLVPRKIDNSLDVFVLSLYIGAVVLQAMSIGLWAIYLRRNSIAEITTKIQIIESQNALKEANDQLENRINQKTKELQTALETTQANEEELRQNIEEIQATQEELESQRKKLLDNQEAMLLTEKTLKEQQKELEKQQWVEYKLNDIDEVMRQNDEQEMSNFADNVLLEIVKIIEATRAAFYLFDDQNNALTMIGGYACTPETVQKKTFKAGEGIIGQIIKTKKTILIDDIQEDGLVIESALSKIKSKALIIIPLMYNAELQGVIEISTLNEFKTLHLTFLNQASKNIAGTLQNIIVFQKTQYLLSQSQEITTQLETKTTELEKAKFEIEQKTLEYQRQFNAIDSSLMVMICTLDGEIINANEKFAKSAQYTIQELEGKHLSILFAEHLIQSETYRQLARNVRKQDFFEGEYECITKNKTHFWMRAYYYNVSDGKTKKIMVLAYDITKEKEQERMIKEQLDTMQDNQELLHQNIEIMKHLQYEKDAQSKELEEQMQAIDFAFGMATFDTKGNLKYINEKMCTFLEYQPNEIMQKNIKELIDMRTDEAVAFPEWWESLQHNEVLQGDYAFRSTKQNTIWLFGTFYPVTDAQNYVKKIIFLGSEK